MADKKITDGWPQAEYIVIENRETGEIEIISTGITKEQIGQK